MKHLAELLLVLFLNFLSAKPTCATGFDSTQSEKRNRLKRQTSSICVRNETYPCMQTVFDPLPTFCIYPAYQWLCTPRSRLIRTTCTRQVSECCSGFVKIGENCIPENDQQVLQAVCSAEETSLPFSSGTLTSPNYPNNYPSNSDCSWSIQGGRGWIILIEVTHLQLEPAGRRCNFLGRCTQQCSKDWLRIRDNDRSRTFCGSESGGTNFISVNGNVQIKFRSDAFDSYSGFRLTYRIEVLATTTTTTISTPPPSTSSSTTFLASSISSTNSNSIRRIICFGDQIFVSRPLSCTKHCYNGTVIEDVCQSTVRNNQYGACVCPPHRPVILGRRCLTPMQCAATYNPPRVCYGGMVPVQCLPTCALTCKNKDSTPCQYPPHSNCVAGCMCPSNLPVNHNGRCIARESCPVKRQETSFGCGTQFYRPNVKIVGGETAIKGSWPWAVQIIRILPNSPLEKFQCGGTIICQKWVLTAAHCFQNNDGFGFILRTQSYRIQIGKHNRLQENGSHIVVQTPAQIMLHPQYDVHRTRNDVALIELSQPVQFSKYVRPACLPNYVQPGTQTRWTPTGSVCYVVGWGETLNRGPSNFHLKQVDLTVRLGLWCSDLYEHFNESFSLCVGGRTQSDSCTGDSGGPLLCRHNNRWFVDGITSYGFECGAVGSPGVYTRVPAYSNWIRQVVGERCASLSNQWVQTD